MTENEPEEYAEVTEEDLRLADQMRQELYRALEESAKKPKPPPGSIRYERFSDSIGIGMRDDGTPQPPLTEEEKRHNEEVRQRAREEARQARDEARRRRD